MKQKMQKVTIQICKELEHEMDSQPEWTGLGDLHVAVNGTCRKCGCDIQHYWTDKEYTYQVRLDNFNDGEPIFEIIRAFGSK